MAIEIDEGGGSQKTDGLDPLSGNLISSDVSFPHGDKPKVKNIKPLPPIVNQGFDPQPPAGDPLYTIDLLPSPSGRTPPVSEPE